MRIENAKQFGLNNLALQPKEDEFQSGEDRIRTCGPLNEVTDLANPRFRPLSHLSDLLLVRLEKDRVGSKSRP